MVATRVASNKIMQNSMWRSIELSGGIAGGHRINALALAQEANFENTLLECNIDTNLTLNS
jgi:hypothetical protein